MNVGWDVKKATVNIRNHGIEFSRAATVLDDPMAVTIEDTRHGEQRFVTVGIGYVGQDTRGCLCLPRGRRDQINFSEEGNSEGEEAL